MYSYIYSESHLLSLGMIELKKWKENMPMVNICLDYLETSNMLIIAEHNYPRMRKNTLCSALKLLLIEEHLSDKNFIISIL